MTLKKKYQKKSSDFNLPLPPSMQIIFKTFWSTWLTHSFCRFWSLFNTHCPSVITYVSVPVHFHKRANFTASRTEGMAVWIILKKLLIHKADLTVSAESYQYFCTYCPSVSYLENRAKIPFTESWGWASGSFLKTSFSLFSRDSHYAACVTLPPFVFVVPWF